MIGWERRPIDLDRHCEKLSDEATQGLCDAAPGLLRRARNNDVTLTVRKVALWVHAAESFLPLNSAETSLFDAGRLKRNPWISSTAV